MRGSRPLGALLLTLPLSLAQGADLDTRAPGPTEADLRAAYQVKIDAINAGSREHLSPAAASQLTIKPVKVSLIECEAIADEPTHFLCSALVEASVGEQDAKVTRVELILHREGQAWQVQ
jgi:hypothetical protein